MHCSLSLLGSTSIRGDERATIKALPAAPHRPRPYGKGERDLLRVPGSARDGYGPGTSDFTNAILLQLADQFFYLLLASGHLQCDRSAGHVDSVGSEEVTKFDDFSMILRRAIDLHQRQFASYSLFG